MVADRSPQIQPEFGRTCPVCTRESHELISGLAPVSLTPGLRCHRVLFVPSLERSGTKVAKRRMPPLPIVEALEVIEELGARRRPGGPGRVVDQLDLEGREEALGDGVVPAIAPAAHTAGDPVLRQHPLVVAAGILTSAIRMMQQARRRAPAGQRQAERVEGEVVGDALAHRPADGEARAEIEDHRQVEPALARRDVGDVGHPRLVGHGPLELSRQDVGRDRKRVTRVRRDPEASAAPGDQPADPHEARHALATRAAAAGRQLGVNPRAAVALPALGMDRRDLEAQPTGRPRSWRWRPRLLRVEARARHLERAAQPDREGGLLRSDEREPHGFSFAKKAVAFLRNSIEGCPRGRVGDEGKPEVPSAAMEVVEHPLSVALLVVRGAGIHVACQSAGPCRRESRAFARWR